MWKLSKFFSYITIGEYMKIEFISNDSFSIFINKNYFKNVDYSDKECIIEVVKNLILKIKTKLNMCGFYKVKVYVNKKVGLFLDVIKIENIEFSNNVDLRVIVGLDEDIFYELDDILFLSRDIPIRKLNDKFYVNVNDIDNIYDILELGRYVYGDELRDVLNKSRMLQI